MEARVTQRMPPDDQRSSFEVGLLSQPESLGHVARTVESQLGTLRSDVTAPFFVGIGASHAALAAPVRVLRERGVPAYRAASGELPEPCAPLGDPYVGVSQSGRSPETVRALKAVPESQRLAVVNVVPSPLSECSPTLSLGMVRDSGVST